MLAKFYNSLFDKKWEHFEYFDDSWKKRIEIMSNYIKPGETVLDLGCGKMWLKEYLKQDNLYIGVDYKVRGENTLLCNFNLKEFPKFKVDISFVSGTLEYINNLGWFIGQISYYSNSCVASYCATNHFPDIKFRKKLGWVNHLSDEEIISVFNKNSMYLGEKVLTKEKNSIFHFRKDQTI